MTTNAMATPPEAIEHGCVDRRVTSDESGHDGFGGDGCRSGDRLTLLRVRVQQLGLGRPCGH
jgi:hypothetical protein